MGVQKYSNGSAIGSIQEDSKLQADRISGASPFDAPPFALPLDELTVSPITSYRDQNPRPTPSFLFHVLSYRWKAVLVFALSGSATGLALDQSVQSSPATYSTHALIRLEPIEALPGSTNIRGELRDPRTQSEMIKTRFVLSAALEQEPASNLTAVREDITGTIKRLVNDLKVEAVAPQILRITLSGSDPEELPILVNAVKDAYLREVVGNEQVSRARRKEFLEATYKDCGLRLKAKRQDLNDAEAKAGGLAVPDERLMFDRFALLQHELFRIELEIQRSRIEPVQDAHVQPEKETSPVVIEDLMGKDPLIRQQKSQLVKVEEKIRNWERTTKDPHQHEAYNSLRRDRQIQVDEIESRKQFLIQSQMETQKAAQQRITGQSQERATRLAEEEKLIRGLVARGWDEMKPRAKGDSGITLKHFEVERLEAIAKQLADELEGLRLDTNTVAKTASLQDAADPIVKRGSRQSMRTGFAIAIPIILVTICFFVWEIYSRRIFSLTDIRDALGIRILGALPWLSARRQRIKPTDEDWPSSLSDSVDGVCAAVLRETNDGVSQVLMIASAAPGEGKSTLARHLTGRLARSGKKTLLLDTDLYRPTVHEQFGLSVEPGLGEVLTGRLNLAQAIRTTAVDDLYILSVGTVGPEVFRELPRVGLGAIITELRGVFDVVVIDTSPVLATTQPLLIGRHADTVVLSTLCGVSRTTLLSEATRRLIDLGIPVYGVIVNGAAEANRYGYYYNSTYKKKNSEAYS